MNGTKIAPDPIGNSTPRDERDIEEARIVTKVDASKSCPSRLAAYDAISPTTINTLSNERAIHVARLETSTLSRVLSGSIVLSEGHKYVVIQLISLTLFSAFVTVPILWVQSYVPLYSLHLVEGNGGIFYDDNWTGALWGYAFMGVHVGAPLVFFMYGTLFTEGHEGAPSLTKRICGASTMFVIYVAADIGVQYLSDTTQSYWYNCKGDIYSLLAIIIDPGGYVVTFGLSAILPGAMLIYLSQGLTNRAMRSRGKNAAIVLTTVVLYAVICDFYPGFMILYFSWNTTQQQLFRLTLLPVLNHIALCSVRINVSHLKLISQHNDIWFIILPLTVSSMYSRFFTSSASTYSEATIIVVVTGVMDIMRRFTINQQSWLIDKYLLCTPEHTLKQKYESKNHKFNMGRIALLEIIVENWCCFVVPAIQLLYQKRSLFIRAGYDYMGSFNYSVFLYSSVFGFVVQLITDIVCLQIYIKNGFDLVATYKHLRRETNLTNSTLPLLLFSFSYSALFTMTSFLKSPPHFASDACGFVNNCIPYPRGSPYCFPAGYNNNVSITANDSASLTYLPPIFEAACQALLDGNLNDVASWPVFKYQT